MMGLDIDQNSIRMSHIHSSDTKPELTLRRALWRKGFRYRVNYKRLPASPDIVLPKYKTVVFVHGCFWHGHNGCSKYTIPKTNTEFWEAKVTRNKERDQETWRQLEAKGWFVIIVWECQLKRVNLDETISRVEAEILRNGETLRQAQKDRREALKQYLLEQHSRKERESRLLAEVKNL